VATVTAEIAAKIAGVNNAVNELNQSSSLLQSNSCELEELFRALEELVSGYKI
jgi:hypothetical protein